MTMLAKGHSGDSQLYWVADNIIANEFPDPHSALRDPDGLLAIGGDLSPARLLDAYERGIFPWYSKGQPILWWSPNPRCVLEPDALRISRSLARTLRRAPFEVTFNRAFADVIRACAEPRRDVTDTWITQEMEGAFLELHRLGHGVSVECWQDGRLAGGLYGVALGRIFFGESMFSRVTDASKVALVHLVEEARRLGIRLIDCQIHSRHLQRLGAAPMPRDLFLNILRHYCAQPLAGDWPARADLK